LAIEIETIECDAKVETEATPAPATVQDGNASDLEPAGAARMAEDFERQNRQDDKPQQQERAQARSLRDLCVRRSATDVGSKWLISKTS
jgi:hypothetical protein